jgi:hypothetical protein
MRRKSGWVREREGEGGRENLRLDGVSPALSFTSHRRRAPTAPHAADPAGRQHQPEQRMGRLPESTAIQPAALSSRAASLTGAASNG